jgi:hypothetical protein
MYHNNRHNYTITQTNYTYCILHTTPILMSQYKTYLREEEATEPEDGWGLLTNQSCNMYIHIQ